MIRVEEDRQVDIGIGKHFQRFVARCHRPLEALAFISAGERLADRQTVEREIMMAKDARTVGVVEDTQPPCVVCAGCCPLGMKVGLASMRQAGAKSRETCICSASVSARHSASLTASLALMIETSIADIYVPAFPVRKHSHSLAPIAQTGRH